MLCFNPGRVFVDWFTPVVAAAVLAVLYPCLP